MDLKDIHDFILFVIRKNQIGAISHEQIDGTLHAAQMSRFTSLLPPKTVPNPIPIQQIEAGSTAVSMDYLFPFRAQFDFNQDDTEDGVISLPDDYAHLRALYSIDYNNKHLKTGYRSIPIVNENQLADRLSSQIIYPTCSNPIGIEIYSMGKKVQVYPMQSLYGRCYYYSRPIKPQYVYTIDGLTETYDQGNSVQMVWDEESIFAIIYKALQAIGVPLGAPLVTQYAQYKEQQGA